MMQGFSWEDENHLADQNIPFSLQNLKVYYHVHKSLPLDPILNQMNPVYIFLQVPL
jgi:hypothetical protein